MDVSVWIEWIMVAIRSPFITMHAAFNAYECNIHGGQNYSFACGETSRAYHQASDMLVV